MFLVKILIRTLTRMSGIGVDALGLWPSLWLWLFLTSSFTTLLTDTKASDRYFLFDFLNQGPMFYKFNYLSILYFLERERERERQTDRQTD